MKYTEVWWDLESSSGGESMFILVSPHLASLYLKLLCLVPFKWVSNLANFLPAVINT